MGSMHLAALAFAAAAVPAAAHRNHTCPVELPCFLMDPAQCSDCADICSWDAVSEECGAKQLPDKCKDRSEKECTSPNSLCIWDDDAGTCNDSKGLVWLVIFFYIGSALCCVIVIACLCCCYMTSRAAPPPSAQPTVVVGRPAYPTYQTAHPGYTEQVYPAGHQGVVVQDAVVGQVVSEDTPCLA